MDELRSEFENKVKGSRRVNALDLSASVASMFDGDESGDDENDNGENGDPGATDESGQPGDPGIELKSMKNMKREELNEYAAQFDIDPLEYSNATALKEAIQLVIDEKGLEE